VGKKNRQAELWVKRDFTLQCKQTERVTLGFIQIKAALLTSTDVASSISRNRVILWQQEDRRTLKAKRTLKLRLNEYHN
jgi:hypothetical protein